MLAHHYLSALDLARATNQDAASLIPRARAALRAAGDRALSLNALPAADGFYRAALALWPESAHQQRASLLRLLGTVLYEVGELQQAATVLAEGCEVAATAGLPSLQARIRILLAEVLQFQGQEMARTLAECKTAAAILDTEGDLEGLAEAWLLIGRLHYDLGHSPADQEALERAMAYAQQSGNHRAYVLAVTWLVATFIWLPVPADVAVGRAEQLRQAASGDPWAEAMIGMPAALLDAYTGRFADARQAFARAPAVLAGEGAKLQSALCATATGQMELLIAADPVAAEPYLRDAREAYRAMGERGYLATVAALLAEALYQQDRLDEAQRLTEEAQATVVTDDSAVQAWWRATQAKLLARRGDFPRAQQLVDEAERIISVTSCLVVQADVLKAKAEVDRLAGAPDDAAASLRAALRIYENQHAVPLAEQTKAALASLTTAPAAKHL